MTILRINEDILINQLFDVHTREEFQLNQILYNLIIIFHFIQNTVTYSAHKR